MKKTPNKISKYPKGAWFTYADRTCDYGCQAVEYLWWGYAAYTDTQTKYCLRLMSLVSPK